MTNEQENLDSQMEDQAYEVLEPSGVDEEQDIEAVRQKAKDLEEKNRQLFARAKKAEGFVLKDGHWVKPEPKPEQKAPAPVTPEAREDIGVRDTIAIMNAKVHEDDIGEVMEYAKFKGIPVAEALKSPILKATLAEKAEQRQTAQATTTGRVRSGNVQKSAEAILEKAQSTGEIPDSDADMAALVAARLERGLKR